MFQLFKIEPSFTVFGGGGKNEARKANFAKFCHEFTCWHQGNLAQYYCMANELHKNLRLTKSSQTPDNFLKAKEQFAIFLNASFQKTWLKTVDFLRPLYDEKRNTKPRFCLKGVGADGATIVDLFREDGKTTAFSSGIHTNSGFSECHKRGKYFHSNDLPSLAKNGKYVNPRLVPVLAEQYQSPHRLNRRKREGMDPRWAQCWEGFSHGIPDTHRSAYRSTIITPMTMMGNVLDHNFLERTNLGKEADRYIFGFFCMDHVGLNYFDDIDISISYIVSDWLSLYLIPRRIFTDLSQTYSN